MEIVFAKQEANRNAHGGADLAFDKPVRKFATDKDEGVFLKIILSQPLCSKRNRLQDQELCLGGTNQSQFPIRLSGTVLTAYLPEAKRNKTGVLCRACEKSYLTQLSILLKKFTL